ncbi:MAG: RNA methyltransferase [Clostridiales bacterium]|nr:RNA methyltransferase [Clostridiales bacterium]
MISSTQNTLIKEIRSLKDKKFRDKLGVFVLEGIKPVKEAIELNLSIREIICTEKTFSLFSPCNYKVEVVSEQVFKSISEEVTPQGALAIVYKMPCDIEKASGSCLLLDGVSDPANVGAIIRTAAASGFNEIYLTGTCADAYSQKAVRSSMSGIFRVKVMRGELDEILSAIDLPLVVADMNGQDVFNLKLDKEVCLVIGNEANGVSDFLKEKANLTVKIPMQNGVESLNAAVSAGILMYALKTRPCPIK